MDTDNTDYYKRLEENSKRLKDFNEANPNYRGVAELDQEDRDEYFRRLREKQKKFKIENDAKVEAERKRLQAIEDKKGRTFLDDAFDYAKDYVIDEGIAALGNAAGSFVGVPMAGTVVKEGLKAGRNALGLGKGSDDYELHAIVFPKSYGLENAKKKAEEIIKNKNRKYYRETATTYRFRNIAKTKFEKKSFRSHKTPDFTLIYGKLKK